MSKKDELYDLLRNFKCGECDVKTFCYDFYNIYYPDRPRNEMSEIEFCYFDRLANVVARYSSSEDEIKACPNAFFSDADVEDAIETAYYLLNLRNK